jgi:lysophospholipid acyltransferase (LPLAT)-like uncharacterized protein
VRARNRRDWLDRLVPVGAWLITLTLLVLKWTTRPRILGGAEQVFPRWERGERMILAFWHEQLIMMPFLYRGPRACIMISRHRDGELIARAVRPLGVDAVRGSSTRGWAGALKGMLQAHQRGADLVFAPDGPRGPRYVAKTGAIQVARATGAVIVPIAAAARWCRRLGSWDRMIVPLPGSIVTYIAGTPVSVGPDADAAAIEEARARLEGELVRISELARAGAGA